MSTQIKWPAAQVHWHEGLFLLPHHFQWLDRALRQQIASERSLAWPYPSGVIEASLHEGALANRKIQFKTLHAIMPSGVEVRLGENTELEPLDFGKEFEKLKANENGLGVVLALPRWSEAKANVLETDPGADRRIKRIYRVAQDDVPDENRGADPQRLALRLLNARLLLEETQNAAPDPELELLPVARVVRAGAAQAGAPGEDPEFAPPSLVLRGSKLLLHLVHDLAQQVAGARKDLVEQIKRSGFSPDIIHWPELKNILRLRTLGHYRSRLPALVACPGVTPFEVYLELVALWGELTALQPDRDAPEPPEYDHQNLWPCFSAVCGGIRPLLHDRVAQMVLQVPFLPADGMLRANLEPRHLTPGASYYLGVKTLIEPTALVREVTDGDRFKLMPPRQSLSAVRGVALQHRPFVSFLPAQADLHYFQLDPAASDHGSEMWVGIGAEQAAVIPALDDELNWGDSTFTLYITLPTTSSRAP